MFLNFINFKKLSIKIKLIIKNKSKDFIFPPFIINLFSIFFVSKFRKISSKIKIKLIKQKLQSFLILFFFFIKDFTLLFKYLINILFLLNINWN